MASKFNAGGVYITFDGDDKPLNKTLKSIQGNIEGKLTGALKKFGTAFAAAFAVKKIASFMKESQKLYKVQEQAEVKLAQMMKNAGTYTKENFNEMKQYASELQAMSNYGDEFLMPIIADLSKAKLSTEQLKEATKAAVDLMAGGQSADMLSKVLEKPLEMSQSLRRMGILINQEELKGLTLEQQRSKVLDEINKKYDGMADKLKDPTTQLSNAIGDLKEVVGKRLDNVWKKLAPQILETVNRVSDKIQPFLDNFQIVLQNMITAAQGFGKILSPVISHLWNVFQSITEWIARKGSEYNSVKSGGDVSVLMDKQSLSDYLTSVENEYEKLSAGEKAIVQRDVKKLEEYRQSVMDEVAKIKTAFDEAWKNSGRADWDEDKSLLWRYIIGDNVDLGKTKKLFLDNYKSIIDEIGKLVNSGDWENPLFQMLQFKDLKSIMDSFSDEACAGIKETMAKISTLIKEEPSVAEQIFDGLTPLGTGGGNTVSGGGTFNLDKFIRSINESMRGAVDEAEEARKTLTQQMNDLITQGRQEGKILVDGAEAAAKEAINQYIEWLKQNAEYARLNGRIEDVQATGTAARSAADNLRNANDVSSYLVGRKAYDTAMSKFDEELTKLSDDFAASGEKLTDTQKEEIETKIASINEEKAQTETAFKAAKQTAAFTIAMSLATEAASRAASSIADNLRANGEDERAADVEEGARIFNDSVNNFMDGFSKGGPIMGLIEMIIGWIMELIQRLAPIMQSLETGFASIANVFDGVASLLSPLIALVEYISAPITILVELVSVVFKLMKPLMKVAQNLLKPLNNLIDTIQSWGNAALTDHQEIVVEGFDELVKSTKEIADNVKSLADAVDKVRSTIQSLNKATKSIQSTVSKLINTTYNKDMLRGIYEATIVSIENQKLYKDDSVNLELYKSLFDEYGNVNEEIGNRILLNLNHSELDSNDFYAGTGEKLKDLVSQLMSLQSDQNSGYETLENAVSDVLAAEDTLAEYERQLKEMLAAGGLDAKGSDAIKSTLKNIDAVKEEISNFKKDFGGSDANKATIIGGLKEKIQEVSNASDNTIAELNRSYFGGQSSLGKLEATSAKSLSSIEEYVKTIRDYLMKKETDALVAGRRNELYNQYKAAVEAIDYSGYFGNDGFNENQFLMGIRNYIDNLSSDTLADSDLYESLKTYASDFDIEGSRHSWYDGNSAYENAQSYWTEAIGDMNSILKANISSAAGLLDYMRMTGTTTPVNDWDDSSDTTKQHTATTNLSREQQWNTMMQNRNKNGGKYSSEWTGLISALNEPYYNPNGTYAKFLDTLSDNDWSAIVSAFNASTHNRSDITALLAKISNKVLKSLLNDFSGTYKYDKFSKGGWTGNIPIDKISGFVHGQEYVVKAPYAADYRPMLDAINEGRGSSIFGNQSALQNVNINIDSTIRANDPLSMINEWNKELRNRNLRLELKKV